VKTCEKPTPWAEPLFSVVQERLCYRFTSVHTSQILSRFVTPYPSFWLIAASQTRKGFTSFGASVRYSNHVVFFSFVLHIFIIKLVQFFAAVFLKHKFLQCLFLKVSRWRASDVTNSSDESRLWLEITVVSFYRIRTRECAKYVSVLHCTIIVWPVFCWWRTKQKENAGNNEPLIRCFGG